MKKILSLAISGLLVGSLIVGCSDDKKDKTESSNTKQEQKTFKEETITDNEYIKMILIGKEKNEYGAIALKILIENKTDNRLLVSTENIQVNGVMNDPYWSCIVNAKAQAYSFIEWYPDSDLNTNVKTVDDLKNINGDLSIGNSIPNTTDEYENIFKTQISILNNETKETSKSTEEENEILTEKLVSPSKTTESNNNTETKDSSSKESENNNSTKKNTTKEKETTKKEEPKQKGYYVTCPNGHKVYTENGDWDCGQCYEDYMREQEASNVDNSEEYSQETDDTDNADDDYVDTYNNYWHGEYEEGSDEYNDAYNKLYGDDTEDTTE